MKRPIIIGCAAALNELSRQADGRTEIGTMDTGWFGHAAGVEIDAGELVLPGMYRFDYPDGSGEVGIVWNHTMVIASWYYKLPHENAWHSSRTGSKVAFTADQAGRWWYARIRLNRPIEKANYVINSPVITGGVKVDNAAAGAAMLNRLMGVNMQTEDDIPVIEDTGIKIKKLEV